MDQKMNPIAKITFILLYTCFSIANDAYGMYGDDKSIYKNANSFLKNLDKYSLTVCSSIGEKSITQNLNELIRTELKEVANFNWDRFYILEQYLLDIQTKFEKENIPFAQLAGELLGSLQDKYKKRCGVKEILKNFSFPPKKPLPSNQTNIEQKNHENNIDTNKQTKDSVVVEFKINLKEDNNIDPDNEIKKIWGPGVNITDEELDNLFDDKEIDLESQKIEEHQDQERIIKQNNDSDHFENFKNDPQSIISFDNKKHTSALRQNNKKSITNGSQLPVLFRICNENFLSDDEMKNFLQKYKKDINFQTPLGTVLILATQQGKTNIVKFLLELGADSCRKNKYGYTALDYAWEQRLVDIFVILLQSKENIQYNEKTARYKKEILTILNFTDNEWRTFIKKIRTLLNSTSLDSTSTFRQKELENCLLYLQNTIDLLLKQKKDSTAHIINGHYNGILNGSTNTLNRYLEKQIDFLILVLKTIQQDCSKKFEIC